MWVKHLMFGMFEPNKLTRTLQTIWRKVTHSFYFLGLGIHPTVDDLNNAYGHGTSEAELAGTWLADGYKGVLWSLKGDLDHFFKALLLRSYNAVSPCDFCPCYTRGRYFRNWPTYFENDASWMVSLFTKEQWRSLHRLHWIFNLEHLSQHNIDLDELHVLWLGVVQYLLGSVLVLLCFHVLGGSPQENLDRVWALVVRFYETVHPPAQYTNLRLGSFVDYPNMRKYPCLKGKGAEIKWFLPALLFVWQQLVVSEIDETLMGDPNMLVLVALEALDSVAMIVDNFADALFLPPDQSELLKRGVEKFLRCYSRIAKYCDDAKILAFSTVPKLHFLWHWAQRAGFSSPRLSGCFLDEDFVGRIKEILESCVRGRELHLAAAAGVQKYWYGKDFMLRYNVY